MNYQIVSNRKSGDGIFCDEAQQARLKQIITSHGHQVQLSVIEPEKLEATLKEKALSAEEILIVGGGNGTLTTAARLLHGSGKTLGVLPLGTFNLEARDLKLPLDSFQAAEKLIGAEIIPIDLLKVNEEILNITLPDNDDVPGLNHILDRFFSTLVLWRLSPPRFHGIIS